MAVDRRTLETELSGLDALEFAGARERSPGARLWSATWPKVAAIVIVIGFWQLLVAIHWKDSFVLPGPTRVFHELRRVAGEGVFWRAVENTLRRAVTGYATAVGLGTLIGLAVVRVRLLRVAVGSLITGLQTMPSVAWFPLAILLFKQSESAITFVVVLGAAPSIANGLIGGVDQVPPILVRAGQMLGARGLRLYRSVVVPAAMPSYLSGLKQGWAFAWRSLMAGELIAQIPGHPSIGSRLQFAREQADAPGLIAFMVVVLIIGITVDVLFNRFDLNLRRKRGLASEL